MNRVVDDNGEVHFEKIQTHVDRLDDEIRHIADGLLKKCQNPSGADQCERAFSIHKCWKMNDPKVCSQHKNSNNINFDKKTFLSF